MFGFGFIPTSINAFAIAAGQNRTGEHDSNGAFVPAAQKFAKAYGCPWRTFDNTGEGTTARTKFFDAISTGCPGGTNFFACFCHGIESGLCSPHIYKDNIPAFLEVLKPKIVRPFYAAFYACSAGAANGWTDALRSQLGGSDVWIYGHTCAGHATLNPAVSEQSSERSPTFRTLYYGTDLGGAWADGLRYTDLWMRYPWMEDMNLDAEVNSRRLMGTWQVKIGGSTMKYNFEFAPADWSLSDDGTATESLPTGKVTATAAGSSAVVKTGTWLIAADLAITWNDGGFEQWPLPLRVTGQTGTSGGTTLIASRLSEQAARGTLQG